MFAIAPLLGTAVVASLWLHWQDAPMIKKKPEGSIMEEPSEQKQKSDLRKVAPGTWGGEHIQLEVTESGAQLEFDCAHGSMPTPPRLDKRGRFVASGEFVHETPGPIRLGYEPKARPASYSGDVKGKTMTLRIRLSDSGEVIGTYTLEWNSPGRIRKCR